jgi:RNA polymerase sigma-70 factor (ECF subfamily)
MRPRRRLRTVDSVVELDDPELLERIADPDALGELLERHQQSLFAMAMAMLRNAADAEEVVQDTFVQAYRAASSYRGDATVSTWLHSICRRQVLARTRRKRHLTVAYDASHDPVSPTRDDALRLAVDAAIDQLPDINREAFILVDVLGLSRTDAAHIVGIEDNTMRARVARARRLIADELTPPDEP